MGAETFYEITKEKDCSTAFSDLREQACYEHGHGGYTGTIAEKDGYTMSNKPNDIDADTWIDMIHNFDFQDKEQKHYKILKKDYQIYDDKWGDALCIQLDNGYIFCGWASS